MTRKTETKKNAAAAEMNETQQTPAAMETEHVEPIGPAEKPKNWGPPYKAIYTNAEKGFELARTADSSSGSLASAKSRTHRRSNC